MSASTRFVRTIQVTQVFSGSPCRGSRGDSYAASSSALRRMWLQVCIIAGET